MSQRLGRNQELSTASAAIGDTPPAAPGTAIAAGTERRNKFLWRTRCIFVGILAGVGLVLYLLSRNYGMVEGPAPDVVLQYSGGNEVFLEQLKSLSGSSSRYTCVCQTAEQDAANLFCRMRADCKKIPFETVPDWRNQPVMISFCSVSVRPRLFSYVYLCSTQRDWW